MAWIAAEADGRAAGYVLIFKTRRLQRERQLDFATAWEQTIARPYNQILYQLFISMKRSRHKEKQNEDIHST